MKKYLIIPALSLIKANIIGEIYISELAVILVFFFNKSIRDNFYIFFSSWHRFFLCIITIWFFSQVASDIYNNTDSVNFLRGWAKIILFLILFLCFIGFMNDEKNVYFWLIGYSIMVAWKPFSQIGFDESFANWWKFGLCYAFQSIVCLIILRNYFKKNKSVDMLKYKIATLYFLTGVASFFLNARSVAGISLVIAFLLVISVKNKNICQSNKGYYIILFCMIFFSYLIFSCYSWGASSGAFGEEAKEKYYSQVSDDSFASIIAGGRSEILVSVEAISNSPIMGYGSWAQNQYYSNLLGYYKSRMGDSDVGGINSGEELALIPSHSYLFGSWVEAGILGGAFWLAVGLFLLLYAMPLAMRGGNLISVYLIINIPFAVWAILFSPFGATVRFEFSFFLAIVVNYCSGVFFKRS